MTSMATYNRPRGLNVREKPSKEAPVLRIMHKGDSEECFGVDGEWARLRDGYAMAKFLEIEDEPDEKKPSDPESPAEVETETPAGDDDERAVLGQKTVAELRDIAEQSGISVKKGAKKDEIIDALLSDD